MTNRERHDHHYSVGVHLQRLKEMGSCTSGQEVQLFGLDEQSLTPGLLPKPSVLGL